MKKLLCTIFAALLAVVSLAGCGKSETPNNDNTQKPINGNTQPNKDPSYVSGENGEWIEVQSIKYDTPKDGTKTQTSYYITTTKQVSVSKSEYENAKEEQLKIPRGLGSLYFPSKEENTQAFDFGKKSTLTLLDNNLNKIYYWTYSGFAPERDPISGNPVPMDYYYSFSMTSYFVRYVKVRFLNDGSLEINYFSGKTNDNNEDIYITERINKVSYIVTYFND